MESGQGTFDADLDAQTRRPAVVGDEPLTDYQRLIANPFLAVLGWLLASIVVRIAIVQRNSALFLAGLAGGVIALLLIQVHCLDCGTTVWLIVARRHACAAIAARRLAGWQRRRRGPGVKVQLAAWFVVLGTVFLVGWIIWAARR